MYLDFEKVGKLIAKQRNAKEMTQEQLAEEELNNNKYTYNYEYNDESSLTKLSHNNQDFNYIYDILGRLEESNINNTYKTKYKYITYGNKTSTTIKEVDDNGIIYNYIYDKLGNNYIYDKLGNITEIYKNNSLTNKYYYDTHSQLIKKVIFIYYYF